MKKFGPGVSDEKSSKLWTTDEQMDRQVDADDRRGVITIAHSEPLAQVS